MVLNRRHWAVQDKKLEIDPWAPAAADLLNKYMPDMESASKASDLMAGMTVIMGLGGMVVARANYDRQVAEMARQEAARARRAEYIEQEHRIDPETPAQAATARQNGHRPGSGAAPTHPGKIEGLGGTGGAF